MGWHIHTKDGKFNIWSTIVDEYILSEWVTEQEVKKAYIEGRLEVYKQSLEMDANVMINNAKASGFCGLAFMQCKPKVFEQVRRENAKFREEAKKP